jgi:hypothetical protein
MKPLLTSLTAIGVAVLFAGCETTSAPAVSDDGLVRIKSKRAEVVYVQPGASLDGYDKIMLTEPQISFRKNWKNDWNMDNPMRRVDDRYMAEAVATGKRLLLEEFEKALTKKGFTLVDQPGSNVLTVRPAIIDLDIFAPDPNNTAGMWSKTYSNGSGRATMFLELFDSSSNQLLVRVVDTKDNENDGTTWRMQRNRNSNMNDARFAFSSWGTDLANGLIQAQGVTFADAPMMGDN